jgi:hypothetical protein
LATDKARIPGEPLKCSGRGSEQEVVDELLVATGESAQRVGQGESHQEVGHRQQQLLLASQPAVGVVIAALGTVAILTRVVAVAVLVAWTAVIDLPA